MKIKTPLIGVLMLMIASACFGQLTADFSADVVSGCAPILVKFSDKSSGGPDDWKWDLGNGTLATGTNPSTTYLTSGSYTVKLTVSKGGSQFATVTKTAFITVYATPVVNFGGMPTSGCLPVNVQFRDSSKIGSPGTATYQWDFGDGNIETTQNPSHLYDRAGKFRVALTVRDGSGCVSTEEKLNYITTFDSITANFGVIAPATCSVPATYKFVDSSTGSGIVKWNWDFGDGGTSILKNPSHVYTNRGNFSVKLIVQNSNGCLDTIFKQNIISSGNFTADFDIPASVCVNNRVSFTNTSVPSQLLDSARWNFGDGKSSRSINGVNTYLAPGNYTVALTSWFGGCADSVKKTVEVLPAPVADFEAIGVTNKCSPPLSVQFSNKTTGGTVVKWNFGNGTTSTEDNPTINFTGYGRFDVSLIVRNPSGCFDTLIKKDFVTIEAPKVAGISGLPYRSCIPWTNNFSVQMNDNIPIKSLEWDFGDGTTSTTQNPTHTFTDTIEYTVKVIITTEDGCTDTAYGIVHGGFRPVASFLVDTTWACQLPGVAFTNTSSIIANGWYWEFGDGGTSEEQNPNYIYQDTGYMTVTMVAYNNGCADTVVVPGAIYIHAPIAKFNNSTICTAPNDIFFTDNSVGGTYWQWNIDTLDVIESEDLSYTFPGPGNYDIKLVVKDSLCESFISKIISVIDEKAAFVTSDSGNCGISYKTFEVKGPQTHPENIVSYKWDFGDGSTMVTDTNIIVHPYRKVGKVNVRLIIEDINGCSDTAVIPVDIKLFGPKADFAVSSNAICVGSVVTFYDSTLFEISNPIVKWRWDFGNGIITDYNDGPFTTTYLNGGSYTVKLIVEDSLGCSDSIIQKNIVVAYDPKADFTSADTLVCLNSPVAFVNNSVGAALTSRWDFGNSTSSTSNKPVTKYDSVGKYDVQLIVRDSLGCRDTLIKPQFIKVENAVANFSISDSFTTCPPAVIAFTNNSTANVLNSWDFGNGNSSSLVSPTHTYTTPGIFIAKLVVTGNGGCTDTAFKQIDILGPYGDVSYTPLIGCPPLTVRFETHPKNSTNVTYDFSDGISTITSDTVTTHSYLLPGIYVPRVIFADNLGCKLPLQGLDTIRVVGAKAYMKSLPQYQFCDSADIQFTDSTIAADVIKSYKWDFGDGNTSTLQSPRHLYKNHGRFKVTLEVLTVAGCLSRDTISQDIIIAESPILVIGGDSAACVPVDVQFKASWTNRDTSILTYTWDFGNGITSDQFVPPTIAYNQPGIFNVRLLAVNEYGCTGQASKIITINDSPNVVVNSNAYLCLGDNIQLSASGGVSYVWDQNTSLSCLTCANPVAKPTTDQNYTVTATDVNGCIASADVLVQVKAPATLSVSKGDTLCAGESFLLEASGTENYSWSPAETLSSSTIANPIARPLVNTSYMVVGHDSLNCFFDTAFVKLIVYPIPVFNILQDKIAGISGTTVKIQTSSSSDVTRWTWTPSANLSCNNCAEPQVLIGIPVTYTALAYNPGNCSTEDQVTVIPICDQNNVFIPNTFSPNGDGQNDVFFPHGRGLTLVRSMRIFSRWGELVYERKDFAFNDPRAGWDGTYKGAKLSADVYVYMMEVLCDDNSTFTLKGDITLIR